MKVEKKKIIGSSTGNNKRDRVIKSRPISGISYTHYDLPSHLMVLDKDEYNKLVYDYKVKRDDSLKEYVSKLKEMQPIIVELNNLFSLRDTLSKNIDININKINHTNNLYTDLLKVKQQDIKVLKDRQKVLEEEISQDTHLLDSLQDLKKDKTKLEEEIDSLKNKEQELQNDISKSKKKYDKMREDLKEQELTEDRLLTIYNELEQKEQQLLNKEYELNEGLKFIDKKKGIMKQLVRELEMRYQKNFSQYDRFKLDN